jgi:complement component 1 Q subcomponent-binding protein, mitochondrial
MMQRILQIGAQTVRRGRSSIRNTFSVAKKATTVSYNATRQFASSKKGFVTNHQENDDEEEHIDLNETLLSEIEEEASNVEIDSELVELRAQIEEVWAISPSSDDVGIVTLGRTFGKEKIAILFHVQDENREDVMDDMMGMEDWEDKEQKQRVDNADDDDEFGDDDHYGIDFKVAITKSKQTMIIDCVAGMQNIIKSVTVHPTEIDAGDSDIMESLYRGPVFDRLDSDLQIAFRQFLEERGVDEDIGSFILSYSNEKEQKGYVDWLQQVQKFVVSK